MLKKFIFAAALALSSQPLFAQLDMFPSRERLDHLEGFDDKRFGWGFFLAGNTFNYHMKLDPRYGMKGKKQNAVLSKGSAGFGAGIMGRVRLTDHFDLRLEPGLHFVERTLTFNTQDNFSYPEVAATGIPYLGDVERTVKSTYLDIPLLVEYHGDRWFNSRPYAAAGFSYLMNMQSNENSSDDNMQDVFRTTTHNYGPAAELGLQFYFSKFKFTTGVRGTFFLNNELIKDNPADPTTSPPTPATPPYWAGAIKEAKSHAFMLVLKFE